MIRTAIIGCGRIAGALDSGKPGPLRSHAQAYLQHGDFELIACFDSSAQKAADFAGQHGIQQHGSDYLEGIRRLQPQVVSVCTPDATHFGISRQLLLMPTPPKLIFLEKPACSGEAELEELISLSEQMGVIIIVNHTRRFDPAHRSLRKAINQGRFGHLVQADLSYYSGWAHNGVHLIDTLDFLFGEEMKILSFDGSSTSPYPGDLNLSFTLSIGDARAFIHAFDEQYYQLFEMDFRFAEGRLRLEDFGQRIVFEQRMVNELGERVLIPAKLDIEVDGLSPMQNAINEIAACIKGSGRADGYRISDIRNTMRIIWEGQQWQQ